MARRHGFNSIMRRLLPVLTTAALLLLLPGIVLSPSSNSKFLAGLFSQHADTRASGVRPQDYPLLAERITGYLTGTVAMPQTLVLRQGVEGPAFSSQELEHLQDVKTLYRLSDKLNLMGWLLLGFAYLLSYFVSKRQTKPAMTLFLRSLQSAALVVILLTAALGLLAVLDFYGVFYRMHQVLFHNDLWLLNPQSDLLIQLMPQPFFIAYARAAGLRLGLILLAVIGFGAAGRHLIRKRGAR